MKKLLIGLLALVIDVTGDLMNEEKVIIELKSSL
jgi:hypothetical protein